MSKKIKVSAYRSRMLKRPVADFQKKSLLEKAAVIESMRREVVLRESRFNIRGLYSHGLEALKEKMSTVGFDLHNSIFLESRQKLGTDVVKRSDKGRNLSLLQAYNMLRSFLDPAQTVTNSVGGIQRVNAQQDRLVFGVDDKGNALGTLGTKRDMREKFWALVDAIRSSDVIEISNLYFFQSDGFINLWKNSVNKGMSVPEMAKAVQDLYSKKNQEYPPTMDGDDSVDVEGEDEAYGEHGIGDYFTGELLAMFEKRGVR